MDYTYLLGIDLTSPQGAPQEISEIYKLINREITLAKATHDEDTMYLHLSNVQMFLSGITALTDKFESIQRVNSIADKFQSSLNIEGDLARVKDRLGVTINEAKAHCVDYERRLGNLEFQNRMHEHDNQSIFIWLQMIKYIIGLKVEVKSLKYKMEELRLENADTQELLQHMIISKVLRHYLVNTNLEMDKLERLFNLSQEGFCVINSE